MVPKSSPVRLGRHLGAHLGNLGGLLGDSWGALGRSWEVLGELLAGPGSDFGERCGAFGAQEMISDDLETNLIDLGTILNGFLI